MKTRVAKNRGGAATDRIYSNVPEVKEHDCMGTKDLSSTEIPDESD